MSKTDGGFGDFGGDGRDFGEALSFPGVDYIGPWRAAKREADRLNELFAAAGIQRDQLRAFAVSEADGSASVDFQVTADGARRLARLLAATRRG